MNLPGRPAGASDHAVQIETDRILERLAAAKDTAALLAVINNTLGQAATTLATGDGISSANNMVDHHDARLTQYCVAGGPLDLFYRGRFGADRAALDAVFAEAFSEPVGIN